MNKYKYVDFILEGLEDMTFYARMESRRHKMDSEVAKGWHELSHELDSMMQRARKLASLPSDVSGVDDE